MASIPPAPLVRPEDMTDHPYLPDNTGHNCLVCELRDDALHLCWPEAHPVPDKQHQWFIRLAVEAVDKYQDGGRAPDLSPEDKIARVMRTIYAFEATEPIELTEELAVYVAALVVIGEEDQ